MEPLDRRSTTPMIQRPIEYDSTLIWKQGVQVLNPQPVRL